MDAVRAITVRRPADGRLMGRARARHRRCGWRGMFGVVSLMLFPAIALPEQPAHAAGEWIRASVTNDWVQGQSFAPDASIDAWVTESDGVTLKGLATVTSDGSGMFDVTRDQLGVDIVFGDIVYADDGITQKDVTMTGPLSIGVDDDPAFAFGQLPIGGEVIVYVTGSFCSDSVIVQDAEDGLSDGNWQYDFSVACPDGLGYFPTGEVNLHDADGDATVTEAAPDRMIGASISDGWVYGTGFATDTSVDIWINADPVAEPPTLTAPTDYAGGFMTDGGLGVVPGDHIHADDGTNSRSMTLADQLSIDVAAGPPVTASGVLPAGDGVQIYVWGSACETDAFVLDSNNDGVDDGDWAVDLSAGCPGGLGSPHGGAVLHFDPTNNFTHAQMPPPPQIRASVTNDWVNGGGFVPDSTVEIWVDLDPDTQDPSGSAGTDPDGNFWWDSGLDLDFGDGIVVRDGVIERALTLTGPLSIEADLDAMTAVGTLPTGETVEVEMGGEECGTAMTVADGDDGSVDGNWEADLSAGCPAGLGANAGAHVVLTDADGDGTVAEPPQPPQIRVSVTGDWMEGFGFLPNSPVEIWVNADPVVDPATEIVGSDPDGNINWGFDFDLVFGDEIVAKDGVVERYLMLVGPLSIEADLDAMTAFGTLPVGAEVGVEMNGNACGTWVAVADGDDDGEWSVDASGDCPGGLGGDAWARVLLYDADGDATMAEPPQPPQIRANPGYDWIQGWGFAANGSVDVTIDGGPAESVGTDGAGSFWFNPSTDLTTGQSIVATDGVITRELLIEGPLSIEVDGPSATAWGELPVGYGARVELNGDACGAGGWVEDSWDGTDGLWSVDFSVDCPGGLGDNAGGQVILPDADGDATVAEPPQPPQIQANVTQDWINGQGFEPNSLVEIWIDADPAGPATYGVGTDDGGNFWSGSPTDLVFGQLVVASDGPTEKELLLTGPLSIEVDPVAVQAWGDLPIGAEISVDLQGNLCGTGTMLADSDNDGIDDGDWSVDLSADCPGGLGPQAWAQALLNDDDGDATIVSAPRPPEIQASEEQDWINGVGFEPDSPVDIWVNTDPGHPPTFTVGTDGGGSFWSSPPLDLGFGDVVIASDGAITRELMLEGPLSIVADFASLSATGELPVGAGVLVQMNGQFCGTGAFVNDGDDGVEDGVFNVGPLGDCPGGLGPDAWMQVFLYDDDGDATVAQSQPAPQIQASVMDDWINGRGFAPDSTVDVWINVDPAGPATASTVTDGSGSFWMDPSMFGGADLVVNDSIVASDTVITRELMLEGPLSILADFASLSATGELPVGAGVLVQMNGQFCGTGAFVNDGDDGVEDGVFNVGPLGDCPGGLGPDAWMQVFLYDDDGDATVAQSQPAPQIQASVMDDWINGRGFAPDSTVDVWINVDPAGPATASTVTDGSGSFWMDSSMFGGADLVVNDSIVASDTVITRELMLDGPLSIVADFDLLTATGEVPIGAQIRVDMGGQACQTQAFVNDGDDGSEDGIFNVDLSGDCPGGLGLQSWAQVQLYDDDGDATVAGAASPAQLRASVTNDWINGQGFAPDSQVDVYRNGAVVATVATDSEGQFWVGRDVTGVDLVFGLELMATDSVTTRTLELVGPLSIDVDLGGATASGELPVGAAAQVYLNGSNCGTGAWIEDGVDGAVDGLWSVDLSADCPDGLGGHYGSQIELFDDDGDATVAEAPTPPQIRASVTEDRIEGEGFVPTGLVDLWIDANPTIDPPTATTGTDPSGYFSTNVAALGNFVLGDVIVASDGASVKTLVLVAPLSVDVDGPSALLSGLLPDDAMVEVASWSACGEFFEMVGDGRDGAIDGAWTLDLSAACPGGLGADWDAQVTHFDGDGDGTVVQWLASVDSDADGLDDAEERNLYGTDWTDPDTDNDGLTDGAEINTHHTNPNTADTDNDGLTDGAEINTHHTEPQHSRHRQRRPHRRRRNQHTPHRPQHSRHRQRRPHRRRRNQHTPHRPQHSRHRQRRPHRRRRNQHTPHRPQHSRHRRWNGERWG